MASLAAASSSIPSAKTGTTASSSSTISHPPATPAAAAATHPLFTQTHHAVQLLLANRFTELNALFSAHAGSDLVLASFSCWLRVVEAATSPDQAQLQAALDYVWSVEARARHAATRTSKQTNVTKLDVVEEKLHQATQQLIRGDTHFLGGVLQMMMESYVKSMWNINSAWSYYDAALKTLDQSDQYISLIQTPDATALALWNLHKLELAECRSWALFGEGVFQFLMSLLPPSVAKIGSWVGFRGEREKGIAQLTTSYRTNSFMAPMSALLLGNLYLSIITYLGETRHLDVYIPAIHSILEWSRQTCPDSWFFLLMHSRFLRHERQLTQAIRLADDCILKSHEGGMPQIAILLNIHTAWCSLFCQDWTGAAQYLDRMLHRKDAPGGWYDPAVDYITDRTPWTPEQIAKLDHKNTRIPASRVNTQAFYSILAGVCYLHLYLEARQDARQAVLSESPSEVSLPSESQSSAVVVSALSDSPAAPVASSSPVAVVPSPALSQSPINPVSSSPPASSSISSTSSSSLSSNSGLPPDPISRDHLNRAYWYIQNSLSLLDSKRYKPMDIYSRRKSLEILARPLPQLASTVWLDTCELFLKWNSPQQQSASQIDSVIQRLKRIEAIQPNFFSVEQHASTHLYLAAMYRGLGAQGAVEARKYMTSFSTHIPVLQSSARARVEGTLCFGYYESAMLYFEAGDFVQAKAELKKAQAQKEFDQINVMMVRCHALARQVKEAALAKKHREESRL